MRLFGGMSGRGRSSSRVGMGREWGWGVRGGVGRERRERLQRRGRGGVWGWDSSRYDLMGREGEGKGFSVVFSFCKQLYTHSCT